MENWDLLGRKLVELGIISDDQFSQVLESTAAGETSAEIDRAEDLTQALLRHQFITEFQFRRLQERGWRDLLVGDYILLDEIGHGGMGTVYKAWHALLKRSVAIKSICPRGRAHHKNADLRFQREMQSCARLRHRNLVDVYDAVEDHGQRWLVMELLEGLDLQRRVTIHGVLSIADAVDVLLQAGKGLSYAHAQGIVHRDIKPSNLFLDEDKTVRVLDFGLAKLTAFSDSNASDPVTASGTVVGTAAYLAPEQAIPGTQLDERVDVYALGCTGHFLLTGRPPYTGTSMAEQIIAHRDCPIPKIDRLVDCPTLQRLLNRMMQKTPTLRQSSMAEVVSELDELRNCWNERSPWAGSTTTLPVFVDRAAGDSLQAQRPKRRSPLLGLGVLFIILLTLIPILHIGFGVDITKLIPRPEADPRRVPVTDWSTVRTRLEVANPNVQIPADAFRVVDGRRELVLNSLAQLTDIGPLRGFALDVVRLTGTQVTNLTPLLECGILELDIGETSIVDLSALRGLKLENFAAYHTRVTDIGPLRGMPLWYVDLHESRVVDLSPLAASPVEELDIHGTPVTDLTPLRSLRKLTWLDCSATDVDDLSDVEHCPLQQLFCNEELAVGRDLLEIWPELTHFNGISIKP